MSSPRPWRCFHQNDCEEFPCIVFSTSVEVFPPTRTPMASSCGLLHVRGGVSGDTDKGQIITKSSPRPWRCFQGGSHERWRKRVFSTSVEVFPSNSMKSSLSSSLLHVRGGVSRHHESERPQGWSSPRPWRCFSKAVNHQNCVCSLLHVRGGVSDPPFNMIVHSRSSPRPWRCFQTPSFRHQETAVFSTSVEVFRR